MSAPPEAAGRGPSQDGGLSAETWDAIVVGGGPAGLSAATWLVRHRCRVLVLDSGDYRNRWVEEAHGYFGFDPVDPAELRDRAREQLLAYPGVEIRPCRADGASRHDGGFTVTSDGERFEAQRLVIATGVADRFPEVDNFLEHYGASVFHCPTCDGYEARDKRVVAMGWTESMVGFALKLAGWAAEVTVITDGRRFEGDEAQRELLNGCGVDILEDDAVDLLGRRGALEGVRLASGAVVPCELVFFSIAHEHQTDLADALGCERTEERCVRVDGDGQTSVPGVYAAGDLVPGPQLIQVAAASGTVAGVACALSLWAEEGWVALSAGGYRAGMADDKRLQELDEKIDAAREKLEDIAPAEEDDERTYADPDDDGQVEEQTPAPPG